MKMNHPSAGSNGDSGRLSTEGEEQMAGFEAREEEIERRKMEVRQKVELQLGRAEQESRRLAQIWEELQVLGDPTRKEAAIVRKRIDTANRDLRSLGHTCQRKLVDESKKLRMEKLEEISKIIDPTH
ncbi:uncharacterized protein LOC127806214 isoform X2 [Diospyros lotus]|uniref:uncharacterized protein LOC127806214 isoform X2 n=1 Tax=Diospyros lotus TaxID=55363 RepID=UPI0022523CAE|nr:uncharacterized protein LOC127806214 isoform X2 [Diospyros lotus]